jgi:hypothetical protein
MSDTLSSLLMTQPHSAGALPAPVVANPLAAMSAGTQVASQQTELRQRQFDLQQAQLQPAYQAMRQVMATNPDPQWSDVQNALAQSARVGGNVDGLVANANETMARGGKPADFIRAYGRGGMSPWEQGQLAGPQRAQFDTGSGTYYGTTGGLWSPQAGQFNPAGYMAKGLSPTEQMQPYTVMGPGGQPMTVPAGQAYGSGGGGGGGVPPSAGGPGGGSGPAGGVGADLSSLPKPQFLQAVAQRESGGDPTALNYVARADPTAYARGATASGKYQMTNSTWLQGAAWAGVDTSKYPTAMSAPEPVQDQVASAVFDHRGPTPWQQQQGGPQWVRGQNGQYTLQSGAPGGGGGGAPLASGPFIGAASAQPAGGGGGGGAVQPVGRGGPTVQPVGGGGMQYFPAAPGGGSPLPSGYTLPPPGASDTWKASVDQFNTARANYANQANRISPLQQALNTLRANPNLETGPSADDVQNLTGIARVFGVNLGDNVIGNANAYAEINKNLNRYYRSLPGAGRSDMAELDAKLANPNPQMQREALDDLLARTVGVERMNDAAFLNFQQQHGAANASRYATTYADQTSDYASKLDPIGFAFDQMTPAQRTAYRNSLSTPEERTRYYNSIKEASRLYNLPIPAQ